jgi:hypothetical protein
MLVDLRRLALIFSALFLLSSTEPARADRSRADRSLLTKAEGTQFAEVAGVQCSVTYNAGDVLHHGYFPLQIALLNQGDSEVVVDVSAGQQWRSADKITKRVRLAPREQVEFEPLLRARVHAVNEYVVTFEVGGDSHVISVGPSEWSDGGELTVLYCSRNAPEAGAVERWA